MGGCNAINLLGGVADNASDRTSKENRRLTSREAISIDGYISITIRGAVGR